LACLLSELKTDAGQEGSKIKKTCNQALCNLNKISPVISAMVGPEEARQAEELNTKPCRRSKIVIKVV
jgi:hypothetical protein